MGYKERCLAQRPVTGNLVRAPIISLGILLWENQYFDENIGILELKVRRESIFHKIEAARGRMGIHLPCKIGVVQRML